MPSRNWAGGSTTAWRRLRAVVLARDGYQCRIALPGEWTNSRGRKVRCLGVANHVHHIHGKGSGCVGCAADAPSHLMSACATCNLRVGNPQWTVINPRPAPRTHW